MTQSSFSLAPEDASARTDHSSEPSSSSEASTGSYAESGANGPPSSATNSRSTSSSYAYNQLNAPPPSPASSIKSSSSDSAREPGSDTSSGGGETDCSFIDIGSHFAGIDEANSGDEEGEGEEEEEGSFVDEGAQPTGIHGDQEASWALFSAALSSNEEDYDETVARWMNDNP